MSKRAVEHYHRGRPRGLAAGVFLLIGIALIVVEQTAPVGMGQARWHAAVNASSALAVLAGIRSHHPLRPRAWQLLATALALFALSNLGWALQEAGQGDGWARALDGGCKLFGSVAIGGAVASLLRDGRLRCSPDGVLDGVLVLTGSVLLLGQLALLADRRAVGQAAGIGLGSLGLLALSVALLTVAVRLLRWTGGRRLSTILLVVAAALVLLGQGLVVMTIPEDAPRWVDVTWLLASVLNGAAALHPSMRGQEVQGDVGARGLTPARSAVLTMLLLVNPIVLWLSLVGGERERSLMTLLLVVIGAITLLGIAVGGEADPDEDPGVPAG